MKSLFKSIDMYVNTNPNAVETVQVVSFIVTIITCITIGLLS